MACELSTDLLHLTSHTLWLRVLIEVGMDATTPANESQNKVNNTDDAAMEKLAATNTEFAALGDDAKAATNREHAMTLREALRKYPKAIGWSVLLSLAVAMEGYGKSGRQFVRWARADQASSWQTQSSSPRSSLSHLSTGSLESSTKLGNIKSLLRGRVDCRMERGLVRFWACSSMELSPSDTDIVLR